MGRVFRKPFTKPIPNVADVVEENGQLVAYWIGRNGKKRSGKVTVGKNGEQRVSVLSNTYTAKYRDGQGILQEVSTGCRDKSAALGKLAELERRAELVRAGVITAAQDRVTDHRLTPISIHIEDYLEHLESREASEHHRRNVRGCLDRMIREAGFQRLVDLDATELERWLLQAARKKMSARTRNRYLSAVSAFCNWCVLVGRLSENPFLRIKKANEKSDRRRSRRAMTEDELRQLLDVARRRPLEDALMIRRGPRKGQMGAKVSAKRRAELNRLGREREILYKTLVLTGLRKSELASITIGQVKLESSPPFIELEAADEKNREGAYIPLRSDLASELRAWIEGREDVSSRQSLFYVPSGLIRIFDRDLEAAGIPKVDERGRTLDVHALRTTFATLMSMSGVQPRTTQAAMRHSDIDLTMNVYTDPKLLDVSRAMEMLPDLPLNVQPLEETPSLLAPLLAPNSVSEGQVMSSCDTLNTSGSVSEEMEPVDGSALPVNKKSRLSSRDNRPDKKRAKRLELSTFSLGKSPNEHGFQPKTPCI